MTPKLETPRLILEPLRLEDAAQVQPLFAVWEIVRYLANKVPWPFPSDGVRVHYRDVALPAIQRGDEWHWTLRLKNTPDQVIGAISLARNGDNNRGFWIGLPWQGRGLMSEAVEVVTDYWFEVLGFERLRVPKAVENVASRRISEGNGMRVIAHEEKEYVCGRLASEVWEITSEEWQRHKEQAALRVRSAACGEPLDCV